MDTKHWHLELGILKAKSLNKVDVTLSGVFISVFSPKLLIIKYEYVQIYDAFVSLNGSHLENTMDIQGAYVQGVLKELLHSLVLAVNPRYM